ncbi:hypothetical protein BpHYR1_035800 [Brachionus plicatilis]|uniref:Uncharacterized protein n=1 Tax=Brachionus plicatilis TaxID=10195 RepID=A0A3M7QU29_BRAPC|nr:hypothetical protein BpHYR1_035800 [Brachionus plicatilis]
MSCVLQIGHSNFASLAKKYSYLQKKPQGSTIFLLSILKFFFFSENKFSNLQHTRIPKQGPHFIFNLMIKITKIYKNFKEGNLRFLVRLCVNNQVLINFESNSEIANHFGKADHEKHDFIFAIFKNSPEEGKSLPKRVDKHFKAEACRIVLVLAFFPPV